LAESLSSRLSGNPQVPNPEGVPLDLFRSKVEPFRTVADDLEVFQVASFRLELEITLERLIVLEEAVADFNRYTRPFLRFTTFEEQLVDGLG
jgi:hypothetical protein